MIVVRVEGGLGNQMFQYAFGLQLAERHGTELRLDLTSYGDKPAHAYQLDQFRITAQPIDAEVTRRIPHRYRPADQRFERALLPFWQRNVLRRVKEKPFGYRPRYRQAPDDVYLVGYWQSESFFPDVVDLLRDQFTLRQPLSPYARRLADRLHRSTSLALHVRRGDYVTNPEAARLYVQQPPEYYYRAAERFAAERGSDIELFVFSNDPQWCQQHLRFPWRTHWVDPSRNNSVAEDLVLMSQAAGCVIANSTFSWWAAWLGEAHGQRVFAPSRWFNPGTLDDDHIVPARWTRVAYSEQEAA